MSTRKCDDDCVVKEADVSDRERLAAKKIYEAFTMATSAITDIKEWMSELENYDWFVDQCGVNDAAAALCLLSREVSVILNDAFGLDLKIPEEE